MADDRVPQEDGVQHAVAAAAGPGSAAERGLRYCGRWFSSEEMTTLRRISSEDPKRSRRDISLRVCEALDWRKRDGGWKEMSCRVALLRMERAGLLALPPARHRSSNGQRYERRTAAGEPGLPVNASVNAIRGLRLTVVSSPTESLLWNELIDRYHYLGYEKLPGAQLRYLAYGEGRPLAALGFGAAAWKTAPRDKFIGWSHAQRVERLHLVVNNARFLILPWVHSRHLASKLLGLVARRLPQDWSDRYGYRPVLLETFVEKQRFRGTCYRAANWLCLGETQGRGKLDVHTRRELPVKTVWVLPLARHFRRPLCAEGLLSHDNSL